MAKVTINNGALSKIQGAFKNNRNLQELGKTAVDETRISMRRGISPVRGVRTFQRYSDAYTKAIKNGWLEHSKSVRPVNLILSGKMLAAITYEIRSGYKLAIGIFDSEMVKLAGYHQNGTDHMPARKFIPTEKSDKLTVTIERALLNKIQDIINTAKK